MSFLKKALAFTTALSALGGAYAKLNTSTSNNVVVYWGLYLPSHLRKHSPDCSFKAKIPSTDRAN